MRAEYHRILFVFVDGVGLAPASAANPLSTAEMPAIGRLLGGPLTSEQTTEASGLLLKGIDARLGVEGLPQSATGQTTLFTGINGAALMGRHLAALPGPTLRAALERESLFSKLAAVGRSATFANAYSRGYLDLMAAGKLKASATTRAVEAGGQRLRLLEDLERGEAVTWDIERDLFRERTGMKVEPVSADQAGGHLVRVAAQHDLTLFETFLTDIAGHGRWGVTAEEALRRVDQLLAGVLDESVPGLTLLLTSDHGNIEDSTTRSHTLNPVPLLVVGPLASAFADLSSILEITPRIVRILGPERANLTHSADP